MLLLSIRFTFVKLQQFLSISISSWKLLCTLTHSNVNYIYILGCYPNATVWRETLPTHPLKSLLHFIYDFYLACESRYWETVCLSSSAQVIPLNVTTPCVSYYREPTSLLTLGKILGAGGFKPLTIGSVGKLLSTCLLWLVKQAWCWIALIGRLKLHDIIWHWNLNARSFVTKGTILMKQYCLIPKGCKAFSQIELGIVNLRSFCFEGNTSFLWKFSYSLQNILTK